MRAFFEKYWKFWNFLRYATKLFFESYFFLIFFKFIYVKVVRPVHPLLRSIYLYLAAAMRGGTGFLTPAQCVSLGCVMQQVRDRLHSKGTYLWSSSISMGTLQNCCAARYGQLGHFWKKTYRNQLVTSGIIKYFQQKCAFSFVFLKESLHLSSATTFLLSMRDVAIP